MHFCKKIEKLNKGKSKRKHIFDIFVILQALEFSAVLLPFLGVFYQFRIVSLDIVMQNSSKIEKSTDFYNS